jgi:hypothetical protein
VPDRNLAEQAEADADLGAAVEPIWRTAMRHGLRTAVVFWPGVSMDVAEQSADSMVATAASDVPSAQHVISLREAQNWTNPPPSFNPPQEGSLTMTSREGGTVAIFNALVVDSTDDAVSNYDMLILDTDKDLSNGHVALPLGQWKPLVVSPRLSSGAYLCFTGLTSHGLVVYASSVNYTRAHPDGLLSDLNSRFGFAPPSPDVNGLRAGWITPQQYLELMTLRANWMMDVALYVQQASPPDLLLTTQTIIADCARAFLLQDPRQEGYSSEQAAVCALLMQKAHQAADANLGRLLAQVDLAGSAVLVVSGQGLAAVHTSVRLNSVLRNAGLLQLKKVDGEDVVGVSRSKAVAFASGGCGHIYINLQGKERSGLVAPDEYAQVQKQIIQALEGTKSENGETVFARILKHEELESIHLESPNSGDVFVQALPGYCLLDELGFKKVTAASEESAAMGFDATLPEMHGILVAAGNGLASGKTIPAVSATDIAPTIAKILRLQFFYAVDGHALEGVWR